MEWRKKVETGHQIMTKKSISGISGGRTRACFDNIFLVRDVYGYFRLSWTKITLVSVVQTIN